MTNNNSILSDILSDRPEVFGMLPAYDISVTDKLTRFFSLSGFFLRGDISSEIFLVTDKLTRFFSLSGFFLRG
jgi:hypothetical protein